MSDDKSNKPSDAARALLKIVLFLGFFLQFVLAFLFYVVLYQLNVFAGFDGHLKLMFELLFALLPAVPLGFLLVNFVFHHIPVVKDELAQINSYKSTQTLLLKLLFTTFLFILFAAGLILAL